MTNVPWIIRYWLFTGRIFYYNVQFDSRKKAGLDYLIQAANAGDEETIKLLQDIAQSSQDKNSVHANYALGMIFYDGTVVKKNFQLAKNYFIRAGELGNIEAKAYHGIILLQEESDNQHQEKQGLSIVRSSAERGSLAAFNKIKELANPTNGNQLSAQLTLGRIYFFGLGVNVKRDFKQAAYYLFDLYFKASINAPPNTLLFQFSHPEIRKYLNRETIEEFVYTLRDDLDFETVKAIFEEARIAGNFKIIFTLINNSNCRQHVDCGMVLELISDPKFYQALDDESIAGLFIIAGNLNKLPALLLHKAWPILKTKLQKSLEDSAISAKVLSCIPLVDHLETNEEYSKNFLHDRIQQHLQSSDFVDALNKSGALVSLLQSDLALVKILKLNEYLISKAQIIFVEATKVEFLKALQEICSFLKDPSQNSFQKYQTILSGALEGIQKIENIQELKQFANTLENTIQQQNSWVKILKKHDIIDDLLDGLNHVQQSCQQQDYTGYIIQPSKPLNYFQIQLPSMDTKPSSASSLSLINRNSNSVEDSKRHFRLKSYFKKGLSDLEREECKSVSCVLILGDSSSGKTSLLQRYINDSYSETELYDHNSCSYSAFKIANDPKKLSIMDLHQIYNHKYNFSPDRFIGKASLLILTIDLSDKKPLINFGNWMNEIMRYHTEKTVLVVVGTKADLVQQRMVCKEDILNRLEGYKSRVSIYGYFEVSAKENTGPIQELFVEPFLFIDYRERLLAYIKEEKNLLKSNNTSDPMITKFAKAEINTEKTHSLSELVSIVKDLREKLTPVTPSSFFSSSPLPSCLVNLNKKFGKSGELLPKLAPSEESLVNLFVKKFF